MNRQPVAIEPAPGLPDAPPPEELSDTTLFLLAFNGKRAAAAFAQALNPLGLRPQQLLVLTLLDSTPGMTQRECVVRSQIDPSTMVGIVDELEEMGLAERRRHPEDRRKHAVHLTAKGKRRLERGREIATAVTDDVLRPLDAKEREQLGDLMRKVSFDRRC
jgi:DNA-binding MarR family transcriptional regulator